MFQAMAAATVSVATVYARSNQVGPESRSIATIWSSSTAAYPSSSRPVICFHGLFHVERQAMKTIEAQPYSFELSPEKCALLIIDMQRDFLEPGGFGEMLGNDVSQLRRTIEPNKSLLSGWRAAAVPASGDSAFRRESVMGRGRE